jgi:hypothetical protein
VIENQGLDPDQLQKCSAAAALVADYAGSKLRPRRTGASAAAELLQASGRRCPCTCL